MQKILKLQHHSHSGKLLAHKHTSFRGIAVVLAVSVLALGIIQKQAGAADTIEVTGKISAAYPTVPAVITAPSDGTTVYSNDIAVQGTCQYIPPVSIVTIYNNGVVAGSTNCNVTGNFTIAILLKPGLNTLIARTSNITDDYGPDSQPIAVRYDIPLTPSTEIPSSTAPKNNSQPTNPPATGTGKPLRIVSSSAYLIFGPRKTAEWAGFIEGGSSPYTIIIDWGDGESETHKNVAGGDLQYTHKYTAMKPHYVQFMARDARGQTTRVTYIAVTPFVPTIVTNTTSPSQKDQTALIVALASIATLALAVGLAWYHTRFMQHQTFSLAHSAPRNTTKARKR